jgi:hypothetical protein
VAVLEGPKISSYDPHASRAKAPRLGVYSKPPALRKLDHRTREAGFLAWVRHDLTEHLGRAPTVVEKMLIDRAAILSLRLVKLDQKIIDDTSFTLHDDNHYVAWQNTLTRVLKALGVEAANGGARPTLADIIAEHDGRGT